MTSIGSIYKSQASEGAVQDPPEGSFRKASGKVAHEGEQALVLAAISREIATSSPRDVAISREIGALCSTRSWLTRARRPFPARPWKLRIDRSVVLAETCRNFDIGSNGRSP
ncbi:hypothetical protein ACWEV3_37180 [Saccharopolyspora sp. NPDC003752]